MSANPTLRNLLAGTLALTAACVLAPLAEARSYIAGEAAPAEAPSPKSFALFNLNGGLNNAYFGAFQLSRQEGTF